MPAYALEFYEDASGDQPVLRWLREELTLAKRKALGYAMNTVLQQLGGGLFEFRLRRDLRDPAGAREEAGRILLRVFCRAHGDRLLLLVGGYDKGEHPSPRRQGTEIALARARLKDWQIRLGRDQRG
jgi:hypothetical protein